MSKGAPKFLGWLSVGLAALTVSLSSGCGTPAVQNDRESPAGGNSTPETPVGQLSEAAMAHGREVMATAFIELCEDKLVRREAWSDADVAYLAEVIRATDDNTTLQVIAAIVERLRGDVDGARFAVAVPKVMQLKSPDEALLIAVYLAGVRGDVKESGKYLCQVYDFSGGRKTVDRYRRFLAADFPAVLEACSAIEEDMQLFRNKDFSDEGVRELRARGDRDPFAGILWGIYLQNKRDNYLEAKEFYRKNLPDVPQLSFQVSEMAERQGDMEFARECYRVAIDNGDYGACLLLSIDLYRLKQYAEAYEVALLGAKNGVPSCRFLVALELSRQGRNLADVEATVGTITPSEKKKYLMNIIMGEIYQNAGDYPKAIAYYRLADENYEFKDIRPKEKLFRIYLLLHDKENAGKLGNQIIDLTHDENVITEIIYSLQTMP